jgi:hypothetical protein
LLRAAGEHHHDGDQQDQDDGSDSDVHAEQLPGNPMDET